MDKKCCFKLRSRYYEPSYFFRTCLTRMMTTKPIRRKTSTRELMMDSQWIWNRPVNRIMFLSDNLLWGRGGVINSNDFADNIVHMYYTMLLKIGNNLVMNSYFPFHVQYQWVIKVFIYNCCKFFRMVFVIICFLPLLPSK